MNVSKKTEIRAICVRLPEATIAALDRIKSKYPLLSRSALINRAVLEQIHNRKARNE